MDLHIPTSLRPDGRDASIVEDDRGQPDPVARVVRLMLAVYLLPVVALVVAVGGLLVVAQGAGRLIAAVTGPGGLGGRRRAGRPGPHVEVAGSSRVVEASAR